LACQSRRLLELIEASIDAPDLIDMKLSWLPDMESGNLHELQDCMTFSCKRPLLKKGLQTIRARATYSPHRTACDCIEQAIMDGLAPRWRISPGFAFGINSALAFASAELVTAALHEAGHGLAAQSLGFSPRVYAFYENNPSGTTAQDIIILCAGPLASLLLGVLFYLWYRSGKVCYGFGRLVLFWLAWVGVSTFVNYLMVTPFLSAGDTAKIADRLGWPAWPRFGVSALAIVCVVLLAPAAAKSMFALAPAPAFATPRSRRRFVLGGFTCR